MTNSMSSRKVGTQQDDILAAKVGAEPEDGKGASPRKIRKTSAHRVLTGPGRGTFRSTFLLVL